MYCAAVAPCISFARVDLGRAWPSMRGQGTSFCENVSPSASKRHAHSHEKEAAYETANETQRISGGSGQFAARLAWRAYLGQARKQTCVRRTLDSTVATEDTAPGGVRPARRVHTKRRGQGRFGERGHTGLLKRDDVAGHAGHSTVRVSAVRSKRGETAILGGGCRARRRINAAAVVVELRGPSPPPHHLLVTLLCVKSSRGRRAAGPRSALADGPGARAARRPRRRSARHATAAHGSRRH